MELILGNRKIEGELSTILNDIKVDSNKNLFSRMVDRGEYISINCPFHKEGMETHPSCSIYKRKDNPDIEWGTYNCFTCGSKGRLPKLVAKCFEESIEWAEKWLAEKYGTTWLEEQLNLEPIKLESSPFSLVGLEGSYIDPNILNEYRYYHPYMFQRKLTKEVIQKFNVGYDKDTDSIIFPVWNEYGKLVSITRRSVSGKKFMLEQNKNKPIYLLNFIEGSTAYICESQINALTLWTYGLPGVALFGTGSKSQYEILKKSGIVTYYLCFDGDNAGRNGIYKFITNMPNNVIINIVELPEGKDINDLSWEEFRQCNILDKSEWLKKENNK